MKIITKLITVFCVLFFMVTHCNSQETQDINQKIINHSKDYDIPPEIVFAIIQHESTFNPNAVSPTGAVGLMQVMPLHYKKFNFKSKESFKKYLLNPDNNIRVGLSILVEYLKLHGTLEKALKNYSGGSTSYAKKILKSSKSYKKYIKENI